MYIVPEALPPCREEDTKGAPQGELFNHLLDAFVRGRLEPGEARVKSP